MASVGPLPPSSWQVKRKRDEEVDTLNDHLDSSPSSHDASPPPDFSAKRPRTVGPNLPPASLEEKAGGGGGQDENSDTSSDDDDFGPSLPVAGPSTAASAASSVQTPTEAGPQVSSKSQRDDWMIIPPSNSDWSARVDPTKLKARKFNTGRGANAQAPGATPAGDNKWTETAAEKRARLEREMMGITDPPVAKPTAISQESTKVAATTQKIKEYRETTRAPSLSSHSPKSNALEKEDDPSARPFDREKDIAAGSKISTSQRKEMMRRAADFGSRFSSAKYL